MLASKNNSTHTSCFHRKVKSPYVLQYLAFEERTSVQPRHPMQFYRANISRTKTIPNESKDETLQEVKRLIKNRQHLWDEEKENQLGTIDEQFILGMKERFDRIKNMNNPSQKSSLPESREVLRPRMQPSRLSDQQKCSRAMSVNSLKPKRPSKPGLLNFLQYKKSRRELSNKLKRQ